MRLAAIEAAITLRASTVASALLHTLEDTDREVRLAPLYRVLIHNDDVTPMDFVVQVLQEIFHKDPHSAVKIMLEAHYGGVGLVAVLPLEEAELRVDQAHSKARTGKYPLTFSFEPES